MIQEIMLNLIKSSIVVMYIIKGTCINKLKVIIIKAREEMKDLIVRNVNFLDKIYSVCTTMDDIMTLLN